MPRHEQGRSGTRSRSLIWTLIVLAAAVSSMSASRAEATWILDHGHLQASIPVTVSDLAGDPTLVMVPVADVANAGGKAVTIQGILKVMSRSQRDPVRVVPLGSFTILPESAGGRYLLPLPLPASRIRSDLDGSPDRTAYLILSLTTLSGTSPPEHLRIALEGPKWIRE